MTTTITTHQFIGRYYVAADFTDAIEYCKGRLIDMSIQYGTMVNSGRSYGGSELKHDYDNNLIPAGYTDVSMYAEFIQLNERGNPVSRTFHVKAIYLCN